MNKGNWNAYINENDLINKQGIIENKFNIFVYRVSIFYVTLIVLKHNISIFRFYLYTHFKI